MDGGTMTLFPEIAKGADFSLYRTYRYRLWRRWEVGPALNVIMLNPSTADQESNDPTVERMERRARLWGYPALVVTNLFAFRSTDPKALRRAGDPVGPYNDPLLKWEAIHAGRVLCAWGAHGSFLGRAGAVVRMLTEAGVALYALRVGANGEPAHPLYIGYDVSPVRWDPQAQQAQEQTRAPRMDAQDPAPGARIDASEARNEGK